MNRLAIAALAVLGLTACGQAQNASYTPAYELNFMRGCQANGSAAVCSCVWRKIAAEVPVREFDALERLPEAERNAHPLLRQIQGYALSCAGEGAAAPPAPAKP